MPLKQFSTCLCALLLTLTACTETPPESPANDWPKGIDPASLLVNDSPEPDLADPAFQEIFNGKDLSGWTVQSGQMPFEVKDGAIVGTNDPSVRLNSFLCTDETYDDFIFTAEFKWNVLGNSGIMFRAGLRDLEGKDLEKMKGDTSIKRVFGYQSEMDQNERRWTGGIFGESMNGWKYPLSKPEGHTAARAAIVDHLDWNRVTIYAKGNVIKTWINGIPCSHLIDNDRSEGFFGLQVHAGKQGEIEWKNIRVKSL